MIDNALITRAVLTTQQVNSLLSLQAKVDRMGPGSRVRITPAQLRSMQVAYDAVKLLNGVPEEFHKMAKEIGLKA